MKVTSIFFFIGIFYIESACSSTQQQGQQQEQLNADEQGYQGQYDGENAQYDGEQGDEGYDEYTNNAPDEAYGNADGGNYGQANGTQYDQAVQGQQYSNLGVQGNPVSGNGEMQPNFVNTGSNYNDPSMTNVATDPVPTNLPPLPTEIRPDARVRYITADQAAVYSQQGGGDVSSYLPRGAHPLVHMEGNWYVISEGQYIKSSDVSDKAVGRSQPPNPWR